MTLQERCDSYTRTFPQWPASWPRIVCDRLQGLWQFGQDFRNKSEYFGSYPGNYLARLGAMFPDFPLEPGMLAFGAGPVLHAFSGSLALGPYHRCDIVQPAEYHCDVRDLPTVVKYPTYDLIVADPPYSDEDAERYKAPPLDRGALTSALARVARSDCYLAWLDTVWPMHRADEWKTIGMIAVVRSTNHRVRLLTLFQRAEEPVV